MREQRQRQPLHQLQNQQHQANQPLTHLSVQQLQEMAHRQQQQIDAQQHMLVAKEQRLKYLRQQDYRHHQMAAEYERLRRLREKVEAQELKLRKLRALRGQASSVSTVPSSTPNAAVLADLESIRGLFNEKEKELALAVRKVEELTHQLEDLRSGRVTNPTMGGSSSPYPPQVVELERLRRELTYRKQLNEQQNSMIAQQRAQLAMGRDEMIKIDNRILELQERLARKRMMNQQLANQINAATSAKQAQLRAIVNRNQKNKPVSTVEPFQRQISPDDNEESNNNVNNVEDVSGNKNFSDDPKYQTLPFGTKFGMTKAQKIEQLKLEKENNSNNNITNNKNGGTKMHFSDDMLPPPPPSLTNARFLDHHQNNLKHSSSDSRVAEMIMLMAGNSNQPKPVSSVAPVPTTGVSHSTAAMQRPTDLFHSDAPERFVPQGQIQQVENISDPSSKGKPKPALPPKPSVSKQVGTTVQQQQQPPPYIPAPPPENGRPSPANVGNINNNLLNILEDSSITIRDNSTFHPSNELSVSTHPEEGTSVDDDEDENEEGSHDTDAALTGSDGVERNRSKLSLNLNTNPNSNVHISINRRIEMPPAFHFPEDQTPPSDLIGRDFPPYARDVVDNAASMMYPMMNQIYKEFDHLTIEEKNQLLAKTLEEEQNNASYEYPQTVPEFVSDSDDEKKPRPPGIIRTTNLKGQESSTAHDRHVCFDPLALLLDASLEGELELVRQTASQVPDPSAANDEGITALHNAICAGHFDIVRFLVEFGCDVNAQDSDGWTPLHCAASCNNLAMVRFLVEHGACIFATTFSDHETAAEKCEEDEEGFAGCSEYLYQVQENLGVVNDGKVFALFDHVKKHPDELTFEAGAELTVVKKGDDLETDWWWAKDSCEGQEGYIPRNFLGLVARVEKQPPGSLSIAQNMQVGEQHPSVTASSMSEDSDSSSSNKVDGNVEEVTQQQHEE